MLKFEFRALCLSGKLYHLIHASIPCFGYFSDEVLHFCLELSWTMILLLMPPE
jgi:hypothetical protein